jgi:hypothetical protein
VAIRRVLGVSFLAVLDGVLLTIAVSLASQWGHVDHSAVWFIMSLATIVVVLAHIAIIHTLFIDPYIQVVIELASENHMLKQQIQLRDMYIKATEIREKRESHKRRERQKALVAGLAILVTAIVAVVLGRRYTRRH